MIHQPSKNIVAHQCLALIIRLLTHSTSGLRICRFTLTLRELEIVCKPRREFASCAYLYRPAARHGSHVHYTWNKCRRRRVEIKPINDRRSGAPAWPADRPTDRYSMRASASASARSSLRERLAVPERERVVSERICFMHARARNSCREIKLRLIYLLYLLNLLRLNIKYFQRTEFLGRDVQLP